MLDELLKCGVLKLNIKKTLPQKVLRKHNNLNCIYHSVCHIFKYYNYAVKAIFTLCKVINSFMLDELHFLNKSSTLDRSPQVRGC